MLYSVGNGHVHRHAFLISKLTGDKAPSFVFSNTDIFNRRFFTNFLINAVVDQRRCFLNFHAFQTVANNSIRLFIS